MRNTGDRKALESPHQQLSPLHPGKKEPSVSLSFPIYQMGDEGTSQSESGKYKGGLLFPWVGAHPGVKASRGPCCPTVGVRKSGSLTGEGRVGGRLLCMAVS